MVSRIPLILLAILQCVVSSGCQLSGQQVVWIPAGLPPTIATTSFSSAELAAQAASAERLCDSQATGLYYEAALCAWHELAAESDLGVRCSLERTYRDCVARFLETARESGQWIPGQGIEVRTASGIQWVPMQATGFAWCPDDFQQLHAVGCYSSPSLSRQHRLAGFGTPVVVDRHEAIGDQPGNRYLPRHMAFSATAVLRPATSETGSTGPAAILELFNVRQVDTVAGPRGEVPLAADFSAPFAFREQELHLDADPFEMFVHPDNNPSFEGLYFIEPYQPGKIPVIFVHGLLSSPRTWVDTANDLIADTEFSKHYQIWAFGYATGKPFVSAAAELRKSICEVTAELSVGGQDPALHEMVLIGHSMGGLISKLQIAHSGNELWSSIASQPFDQVVLPPRMREQAQTAVFFDPLPQVQRVIFVGTPHRGADVATRLIGRVASMMVRRSSDELAMFREVRSANRGTFRFATSHPVPTSIDMLEPRNPMLQATDRLALREGVHLHTIAGSGLITLGALTGDGIVPLDSARHDQAESELLVKASHTELHRSTETSAEILRILQLHLPATDFGWAVASPSTEENTSLR